MVDLAAQVVLTVAKAVIQQMQHLELAEKDLAGVVAGLVEQALRRAVAGEQDML
jgi:hypothetical protein